MTRRTPRTEAGFTLVEVMIAIGIMTVGSLGILAMHSAVSGANRSANDMNTALAITETWLERVDRDALSWTERGLNTTSLTNTDYLSEIAGSVAQTDWFTPSPSDTDESYRFDYFGRDDTAGNNTKYCVNLRLAWLRQGTSIRVDIRTFWYREGYMPGGHNHPNWVDATSFRGADCDAATADGWNLDTIAPPNINVINASTVVQWLRREDS